MTPLGAVAILAAALAVALLVPGRPGRAAPRAPVVAAPPAAVGWMLRGRAAWSALAAVAAGVFVSGPAAMVAAPVTAVAVWVLIGRAEPPSHRRAREEALRDLPHVVGLLADALRVGRSPGEAVSAVIEALPGPASDRLALVVPRLRLGVDPVEVWTAIAADPSLGPLGRTMARAQATGASVVSAVDRLADELERDARADIEDRARAVGVKAALPLGLCLLPAFVLLGIVPVVAGLLSTLGL